MFEDAYYEILSQKELNMIKNNVKNITNEQKIKILELAKKNIVNGINGFVCPAIKCAYREIFNHDISYNKSNIVVSLVIPEFNYSDVKKFCIENNFYIYSYSDNGAWWGFKNDAHIRLAVIDWLINNLKK